MSSKQKGDEGELLAAKELIKLGFVLLERNYRCRGGEIDIIAMEGAIVVFVEVKTRADEGFCAPIEAITPKKQQRIKLAAQSWIDKHSYDGFCRFDAVEVLKKDGHAPEIRHWRNVF